jgi:Fe-S-cluster containining protein
MLPAMSERWYREGLRFSCTRCGDCCTGRPGYVWVTQAELEELAAFLELSLDELLARYVRKVGSRLSLIERANGDCVFFDKGCTVYPARPVQCRTFPFWPENLKSGRAWDEVGSECPGVGKGRLYSAEEIGRIRKGESDAASL